MINVSDFGLNRVTTEYVINEKKRTIVCLITAINDIPFRLSKYELADEDYDDINFDTRTYRGIAKCAPDDEWDEIYGMRLAEYRAQRARQMDVNNELKKFIDNISKCVNNLREHGLMRDPHEPVESD